MQAGRLKHWPSWYRGNLQVQRIGATDRKEVLDGQRPICEDGIESQEGTAFHPGKACRHDLGTRRGCEVDFYMALAKRLAVEEGGERHACQVRIWADVLESWRARERDRYRSVLGLPCPYP